MSKIKCYFKYNIFSLHILPYSKIYNFIMTLGFKYLWVNNLYDKKKYIWNYSLFMFSSTLRVSFKIENIIWRHGSLNGLVQCSIVFMTDTQNEDQDEWLIIEWISDQFLLSAWSRAQHEHHRQSMDSRNPETHYGVLKQWPLIPFL